MVVDLTRDQTLEGETRRHRLKAIGTSLHRSELGYQRQAPVNDLLRQLKFAFPVADSTQVSESESRGSDNNRKRRRSEDSSPSAVSDGHALATCYGTEEGKPDKYVKVKDKSRSDVHIPRSPYIFRPPPPPNGKKVLDLYELYADKLARIPGPPISLERSLNACKLDFNFEFINRYKIQEGVEPVDPNFHAGCDCPGEKCDLSTCTCLSQEEDSDERIVPYKAGKHGVIVLRDDYMKRKPQIVYECSMLCGCGPSCMNRVVERGRTLALEIFDTRGRGFGLRSPTHIQAGQFIDCYLGEVLTRKMADDREAAMGNGRASYFFSLDFFFDDDDTYVVDGRQFGSITRFINHSCKPNCKMFPVSHNHADQRIFSLAFFAKVDIPAGKELTFDYHPNWKLEVDAGMDMEIDPEAVKCLCGEKDCRGQLWPNQRKTMQ